MRVPPPHVIHEINKRERQKEEIRQENRLPAYPPQPPELDRTPPRNDRTPPRYPDYDL